MPPPRVDYEKTPLRKNGRPIEWPRVVGAAAEKAFKVADQAFEELKDQRPRFRNDLYRRENKK